MGHADSKSPVFVFGYPWWGCWAREYQFVLSGRISALILAFQAFPPANMIFAGIGVFFLVGLLHGFLVGPTLTLGSQAAEDTDASQDNLIELFNRIDHFFCRLDIYTVITPTTAMRDMIVEIMVEVLMILAIATEEVKRGRLSALMSRRFTILD
jgi:hypothetical protein